MELADGLAGVVDVLEHLVQSTRSKEASSTELLGRPDDVCGLAEVDADVLAALAKNGRYGLTRS